MTDVRSTAPAEADAPTPIFVLWGSTTNFDLYYLSDLGTVGPNLCSQLAQTCEADLQNLVTLFGPALGQRVTLRVQDGSAGGSVLPVSAEVFLDAFDGTDADLLRFNEVALLAQVFFFKFQPAWNPALSSGSALTLALAANSYPAQLFPQGQVVSYATGRAWLDSPDRPDWVSNSDASTNQVAVGCGVLFLNYLTTLPGIDWATIVRNAAATLAGTYGAITKQPPGQAFGPFRDQLLKHYPPGAPYGMAPDDPYPFDTFDPTGGVSLHTPALTAAGPRRIDVFAIGTDASLYYRWGGDEGTWPRQVWTYYGENLTDDPVAVTRGSGIIDVFAIGTVDRQLTHVWVDANGSQLGRETLGLAVGTRGVSAVAWGERLDVFAVGQDLQLRHRTFDGGAWLPWESLGAPQWPVDVPATCTSAPTAVRRGRDRIDVIVLAADGSVGHISWDGLWSAWEDLPGASGTTRPELVTWGPQRLDAFLLDSNGQVQTRFWDGSSWGGAWTPLAGPTPGFAFGSPPRATATAWNRIDVLAIGQDGAVYRRFWDGSSWGSWTALPGVPTLQPGTLAVPFSRAPGLLDFFVTDTTPVLRHSRWA